MALARRKTEENATDTSQATPQEPPSTGSEPRKRFFHLVTQGKGGAGKSFVASVLCQALSRAGTPYKAYDLDPVNRTLGSIEGITVANWDMHGMRKEDEIDPAQFDALIEQIALDPEQADVVVDVGATGFLSFNKYLVGSSVFQLLEETAGMRGVIHCVVRGGSSLVDCLQGLRLLCHNYKKEHTDIVVWLNEVEGPISIKGKPFEELKIYAEVRERLSGVFIIPEEHSELALLDVRKMLTERMSFDVALSSSDVVGLVGKMRLRTIRDRYLSLADEVFVTVAGPRS